MKSTKTLKAHPAADLFPMATGQEYEALKADIKEHGQRVPIEIIEVEGKQLILDGRNRYKACRELAIEPNLVAVLPDNVGDPRSYVLTRNFHRRHLRPHQKGQVILNVIKQRGLQEGKGARNDKTSATMAEVYRSLGIPQRTAERWLALARIYQALPQDLQKEVDEENLSIAQASKKHDKTPAAVTPSNPLETFLAALSASENRIDKAYKNLGVKDMGQSAKDQLRRQLEWAGKQNLKRAAAVDTPKP